MPTWRKILIGGLGGASPLILSGLTLDISIVFPGISLGVIVGVLFKLALLFFVGGLVAYLHTTENDMFKLFQLGIAAPALIVSIQTGKNYEGYKNHIESGRSSVSSLIIHLQAEAYAAEKQQSTSGSSTPSPKQESTKSLEPQEAFWDQFLRGVTGQLKPSMPSNYPVIHIENDYCPLPPSSLSFNYSKEIQISFNAVAQAANLAASQGTTPFERSVKAEAVRLFELGGPELVQLFQLVTLCGLNKNPADNLSVGDIVKALTVMAPDEISKKAKRKIQPMGRPFLSVVKELVEEKLSQDTQIQKRLIADIEQRAVVVGKSLEVRNENLYSALFMLGSEGRLGMVKGASFNVPGGLSGISVYPGYGSAGVAFQTRQTKVTIYKGPEKEQDVATPSTKLEPDVKKTVDKTIPDLAWVISLPLFEKPDDRSTIIGVLNVVCISLQKDVARSQLVKVAAGLEDGSANVSGLLNSMTR